MTKEEMRDSAKVYLKQLWERKTHGETEELEAIVDIIFSYIDVSMEEFKKEVNT